MHAVQNYKLSKTKQVYYATDNLKVEILATKSVQNLQVTCAELAVFFRRILTTLVTSIDDDIDAVAVMVLVMVITNMHKFEADDFLHG